MSLKTATIMSLQRFALTSLLILSLIGNILLSLAILKMHKNSTCEGEIVSFFNSYVKDAAMIGDQDILDFIFAKKIQFDFGPGMYLIVPPYPCGACLNELIDTIESIISQNNSAITMFVPSWYQKDIKVHFSSLTNVSVVSYENNDSTENYLFHLEDGLLFHVMDYSIDGSFISTPWNKYATVDFLNKYSTQL